MKYSIFIVLFFMYNGSNAQCFPETKWIPSISVEGAMPFGGIVQGGLFSQLNPFSFQAGVRFKPNEAATTKPDGTIVKNTEFDILPRLEFSYRAMGDKDFGVHPFVGISRKPDIGVMVNLAASPYVSFRTRLGYDGKVFVGMGALVFLP